MGSKEISAAWLVAAAILGLFGWLQLSGVHSGSVPLANDLSRRAPAATVGNNGTGSAELLEEENLATRSNATAVGDRDEQICTLDRSARQC